MTIHEAMKKRIPRVRCPIWANEGAYLRLPLMADGTHGPWAELYDRVSQTNLGLPVGSQRIMILTIDDRVNDFEPYSGEPDPAEKENYSAQYTES